MTYTWGSTGTTPALSAWRLARFKTSHMHFVAVSESAYASPWLISAGAFWAARASIKIRKPMLYTRHLEIASAYPRTFYGILARRLLGLAVKYNWVPPPLEKQALHQLAAAPGGQRAISLLQIGEDELAESELNLLFQISKPELARAMVAVVDRANMPSLAMRIGNLLVTSGSILLTLFGFFVYLGEKKIEYKKNFSYITFIFGAPTCRGITKNKNTVNSLKHIFD